MSVLPLLGVPLQVWSTYKQPQFVLCLYAFARKYNMTDRVFMWKI
jgi:hypothetical protein